MYRSTRATQTGLDSISEDLNEAKLESVSHPDTNFKEFFGKKQLKKLGKLEGDEPGLDRGNGVQHTKKVNSYTKNITK
jgi:hypothetical protein